MPTLRWWLNLPHHNARLLLEHFVAPGLTWPGCADVVGRWGRPAEPSGHQFPHCWVSPPACSRGTAVISHICPHGFWGQSLWEGSQQLCLRKDRSLQCWHRSPGSWQGWASDWAGSEIAEDSVFYLPLLWPGQRRQISYKTRKTQSFYQAPSPRHIPQPSVRSRWAFF